MTQPFSVRIFLVDGDPAGIKNDLRLMRPLAQYTEKNG